MPCHKFLSSWGIGSGAVKLTLLNRRVPPTG